MRSENGKRQAAEASQASRGREPRRDVLPIPDRRSVGSTSYDAKDPELSFPPIQPLRPPKGAPNVLVVLLDDVGFGASSAFGGPCQTPTAERLAARGLKYTRFHTTALCSPTRAAMLTGRNHHSVGMGSMTETATAAPGYSSIRPNTCAPLAEILRLNGYATAQFGKCHEVPIWEANPVGPFDHWPTGSGFQHFYGFVASETNQYYPALWENTTPVAPPRTPEQGYHLMLDLADKAIAWIRQRRAIASDQPFFLYFAPGATHCPHHVPKEWIAKYAGKFSQGWDILREETIARQKALGVVPADCELTRRPAEIPAWDAMPAQLRPVLERQMETYAAFLEYADHHVGRVIDTLADLDLLEDTLVYYIIGDSGASAEGSLQGTFNAAIGANAPPGTETVAFMLERLEEFGGPKAYNHYAVGWAHALCTPYQWTKQVASHWGGTRNGTIVHCPRLIRAKGEIRTQFCHVTDIAPTILDVAGLPEPTSVYGVNQEPMHGASMRYSFDDATASERHSTQYFEGFGNRGVYHHGWSAVTRHVTPWNSEGKRPSFDDDAWELYDGRKDWSQAHDLAKRMPDKLRELQRLFLIEAAKYGVLPLDDRTVERADSDLAGRPTLVHGTSQILFPGMGRLTDNCLLDVRNKSHSITAALDMPEQGGHGVVINQGGHTGGWSLYVNEQRQLSYLYNFVGIESYQVTASVALPAGMHQVRMEFAYDGGGPGKGGTATLFVDGEEVAEGRIQRTHMVYFSLDETADVGRDTGARVTPGGAVASDEFSGQIEWVRIDIGDDGHEHMVRREQVMATAAARP